MGVGFFTDISSTADVVERLVNRLPLLLTESRFLGADRLVRGSEDLLEEATDAGWLNGDNKLVFLYFDRSNVSVSVRSFAHLGSPGASGGCG